MKRTKLVQFHSFWLDPIIRLGFLISVGLWGISTILLVTLYQKIPPVVPFFYSMIRGSEQLAEKRFLFFLPALSFIFMVTHFIFARLNYSNDLVFSRIMVVSTSLGSLIFAVAVGHILWIVL